MNFKFKRLLASISTVFCLTGFFSTVHAEFEDCQYYITRFCNHYINKGVQYINPTDRFRVQAALLSDIILKIRSNDDGKIPHHQLFAMARSELSAADEIRYEADMALRKSESYADILENLENMREAYVRLVDLYETERCRGDIRHYSTDLSFFIPRKWGSHVGFRRG